MSDDPNPTGPGEPPPPSPRVVPEMTQALQAAARGDRGPLDALLPQVYDELRVLARRHMRQEAAGHTLQATAVANEAYLRLVGSPQLGVGSRAQFFAAAATAIRRILVDHARARDADKRGGERDRVTLSAAGDVAVEDGSDAGDSQVDVLWLNAALDNLSAISARAAKVVELRFFSGLSVDQAAEAMDVSPRTVAGDWAFARAWLQRELKQAKTREA